MMVQIVRVGVVALIVLAAIRGHIDHAAFLHSSQCRRWCGEGRRSGAASATATATTAMR